MCVPLPVLFGALGEGAGQSNDCELETVEYVNELTFFTHEWLRWHDHLTH